MSLRILVTGASSGLGKVTAEHLAREGYKVWGTGRKVTAGRSADGVAMVPLDINDDLSIANAVNGMVEELGGIDVLVNNAGFAISGAVEDTSMQEVKRQMQTNFFGHVAVIQHVLPVMRRQKAGRVINIGSLAGCIGLPYQAFYSASKAAIQSLTEALRLELTGTGIDCTLIAPGDFSTGFTDARVLAGRADQSVHAQRMQAVVAQYEEDERNGCSPQIFASLVVKLVRQRNLKPVYTVGRLDQRLAIQSKGWLPGRWFEAMVRSVYHLDKNH